MSKTPSIKDKNLVFGLDGEQDVRTAEVDKESIVDANESDLVKLDLTRKASIQSTEIN
jgi:hypothetical protein